MDNIAFRFKASATTNTTNRVDDAQEDQSATESRHTKRRKVEESEPPGTTQRPTPEEPPLPPFLRLPAELRNKIYAYATSHYETLVVTTPNQPVPPSNSHAPSVSLHPNTTIWILPPLAQVNKQFLHEVIPIFFSCNTLSIADMNRIRLWYPFRSVNHMENIAAIFFDLPSSCKYSFTFKKFEFQPTMLIKEDVRKVRVGKKVGGGRYVMVEVEDWDFVVKWEPFERAIASLGENPRPSLFLSQTQLEEAWVEEERRGKRLLDGKVLIQKMALDAATIRLD